MPGFYASTADAVGLDIGTSRVVAAFRTHDNQFEYKSELNSFVSFPASRITEAVLKREHIPHCLQGGEIVVHGNESERFADLLQMETRRPMSRGTLNPAEPENLNVIRAIVANLVGHQGEGKKACFSVPAAPLGAQEALTYHEASIRQALGELGFQVRSVNEGLAVIYSELEDYNFTGVGVSIGGGLCNVCLSYLAVPVLSFSIPKAGDYIDSSAATVTGELANSIRILKEQSFYFNGNLSEKVHQVLTVYYDDMIHTLVAGLRDAFSAARSLPKLGRPIPVVLSGGSVMPVGFRERFAKALSTSGLPLQVSEIIVATNPLYATAKGALVAALSEM